ncbi:hypothetical protein QBC41DRAFT_316597 [Cercophora samala]|uniref:Uncharacterized protein n=1 Tax=Cercophora samala TaxID=330535 RepID=A0AA39ZHA6_9PEZI|nr:hypothetical protein QBC41DRAFT_316597 [Cercophora samala]
MAQPAQDPPSSIRDAFHSLPPPAKQPFAIAWETRLRKRLQEWAHQELVEDDGPYSLDARVITQNRKSQDTDKVSSRTKAILDEIINVLTSIKEDLEKFAECTHMNEDFHWYRKQLEQHLIALHKKTVFYRVGMKKVVEKDATSDYLYLPILAFLHEIVPDWPDWARQHFTTRLSFHISYLFCRKRMEQEGTQACQECNGFAGKAGYWFCPLLPCRDMLHKRSGDPPECCRCEGILHSHLMENHLMDTGKLERCPFKCWGLLFDRYGNLSQQQQLQAFESHVFEDFETVSSSVISRFESEYEEAPTHCRHDNPTLWWQRTPVPTGPRHTCKSCAWPHELD